MQLFRLIKLIIPQYHLIWLLSCFFFRSSQTKGYITLNDCASNHLYNNLSSIKKKSHWFAKEMSFICLINSCTGFGRWGPRGVVSPVRYTLCFPDLVVTAQLAIFKFVGFSLELFTGGAMFSQDWPMNLGGGSLIPPGSHLMALALMLIALGAAKMVVF